MILLQEGKPTGKTIKLWVGANLCCFILAAAYFPYSLRHNRFAHSTTATVDHLACRSYLDLGESRTGLTSLVLEAVVLYGQVGIATPDIIYVTVNRGRITVLQPYILTTAEGKSYGD